MPTFKILSTKKIETSLIAIAKENNIEIIEHEFICVTPINTQEKYEETLEWMAKDKANVVITSANAANSLIDFLKFDDFYDICEWNIFCMSGKTKDTLFNYSKDLNVVATAQSSADLANKIVEKRIKEVVFFCGDKRREELPELLGEKGIKINEVILYETKETPVKIDDEFDGIIFYSPSGVNSFFSLNVVSDKTKLFAIGNTTADALKKVSDKEIIVADEASMESVVKKVMEESKPL